jgi:hypothetical protein
MCSFHTWFHDQQKGYVVECKECQKLQVCFGNVMATFSSKEFERFQRQINFIVERHVPRDRKDAKDILLQTTTTSFCIVMSETELMDLHFMVEQADNERKAGQLLKLFEDEHSN